MAKGMDLRSLDRGRLRHPLFGDRRHWYGQKVPKGWWSKSLDRAASRKVKKEMVAALERVLKGCT